MLINIEGRSYAHLLLWTFSRFATAHPYTNITKLKSFNSPLFKLRHSLPRPTIGRERTPMYSHARFRSKILMYENRIFRWGMDMSSEGSMIQSDMKNILDKR
jgi:hypothetical protein